MAIIRVTAVYNGRDGLTLMLWRAKITIWSFFERHLLPQINGFTVLLTRSVASQAPCPLSC